MLNPWTILIAPIMILIPLMKLLVHPTLGEAIILLMKTNDPFDDFVEHETYVAATIGGSDLKTGFKGYNGNSFHS
ncbi:unnamed protein product [Rhizophagus irregularis]|nr:unnamed protein product [Rhizophagus irregularis]